MCVHIGLRREDKNIWERRVAITPDHVRQLQNQSGVRFCVQPFPKRAYQDAEYGEAGAILDEDLSSCDVILGIKEIPFHLLLPKKIYLFFSHTIKGQKYNMPMLQRMIELGCTLIDYECIKDAADRRLVFFGHFAGMAGMVETLRALGQRLRHRGIATPFAELKAAYDYRDVADAKAHISRIAETIRQKPLPASCRSMVFGFSGYGHVSRGAQDVFDLLPHERIDPDDLPHLSQRPADKFYKVVFEEKHMAEPVDPAAAFDLQDYFTHPEKYRGIFEKYLPYLHVLANGIYWDKRYPRLITKEFIKKRHAHGSPLLLEVVGDISCDINGSIEFTEKATTPDEPVFSYDPATDRITDGYHGDGILVMAVDNLPAEFPRDASDFFSQSLLPYLPGIAAADWKKSLDELAVDAAIKKAVILHNGVLTPEYSHLSNFLPKR